MAADPYALHSSMVTVLGVFTELKSAQKTLAVVILADHKGFRGARDGSDGKIRCAYYPLPFDVS